MAEEQGFSGKRLEHRSWQGQPATRQLLRILACFLCVFAGVRPAGAIVDSNTNSLSDVWETIYGCQGVSPEADPDGDGQTNFQEALAGTNPFDKSSVFALDYHSLGRVHLLRWQSTAGVTYQIEASTNSAGNDWVSAGMPVHGNGEDVRGAVPPHSPPFARFRLRVLTDNPAIELSRTELGDVDTDQDGLVDVDEFAAGTNPFDPSSALQIHSVAEGAALLLSWPTVVGKIYHVETRQKQLLDVWSQAGGPVAGSGNRVYLPVDLRGDLTLIRVRVDDQDSDHDGATDWEQWVAGLPAGSYYAGLAHDTNLPNSTLKIANMLAASNVVCVETATPVANLTTRSPGAFRITRSGNLDPIEVMYSVTGDAEPGVDYLQLSGTVTLGPGIREALIPIEPSPASKLELARSVVIGLNTDSSAMPNYTVGQESIAEVHVVREVPLNVKDFGAVADGIADDRDAILAAIAALESSTSHNTLHFPNGVYRLNSFNWSHDQAREWYEMLRIGTNDLADRDLFFTGDADSVLYSTVNTQRVRMITADASFRSLTFRRLKWRKEGTALPETTLEPNRAEGVFLKPVDLRTVESVSFADCVFENCHGALAAYGEGFDARGKLKHLGFYGCQVINPFGSNTTNAHTAYGGGQQVRMNPWVRFAVYGNNLFDGGVDNPDPVRNPEGIRKDGSHFGSPLHLLFTNNVVRRMGVEAVFQTDEPYMGTTEFPVVIPPPDGRSIGVVTVMPFPTTYQAGQIVIIRTWFHPGADATNVFLTVVAFDPETRGLFMKNEGLTPGVEGLIIPPWQPIYLQSYNPTCATISGNVISHGSRDDMGIVSISKATISGNFVSDYAHPIFLFANHLSLLYPPTPGTVISGNILYTRDASETNLRVAGIESFGPGDTISSNLVVTPSSHFFNGVVVHGTNQWVKANTITPRNVVRHSYDSLQRSVGIGFGNTSSQCTAIDNRTYGMDVGVGPQEPFQPVPHRVVNHFSTDDVLAIDPIGLY